MSFIETKQPTVKAVQYNPEKLYWETLENYGNSKGFIIKSVQFGYFDVMYLTDIDSERMRTEPSYYVDILIRELNKLQINKFEYINANDKTLVSLIKRANNNG